MTDTAEGYISDGELFHFCGRSETSDAARYDLLVQRIIGGGALRHPPFTPDGSRFGHRLVTVNGDWVGCLRCERQGTDLDIPLFENIICFCDIPRAHLGLHMTKYSRFGLGFRPSFLAERGARPVMYFPHWPARSGASIHGQDALSALEDRLRRVAADDFLDHEMKRDFLMKFLAYVKPYDASLPLSDPANYYTEREWRAIGYLSFAEQDIVSVNMPQAFHAQFRRDCPALADRLHAT